MSYLERPGCTCRAAGDPTASMHDHFCPARAQPARRVDVPVHVIEGAPALSDRMRNQIRAARIRTELDRLDAHDVVKGVLVSSGNKSVKTMGPDGTVRWVDGLAALGLLIELPDGAGTQAAWAALLTLPEIT